MSEKTIKTDVIILAGGKGTRMESDAPKVLTTIGGKTLIERVLDAVAPLSAKPVVVVGYKADNVREVCGDRAVYALQKEQLGTGDAVRAAHSVLRDSDASRVIVVLGDHPFISSDMLRELAEKHEKEGAQVSLVALKVPNFADDLYAGFTHFGRIIRNAEGNVDAIREYKDASESEKDISEVNTSYYCFDASWLWEHIDELTAENSQSEYYLTDMVAIARQQGARVAAHVITDPVEAIGINTRDEADRAEELCASHNA